MFNQIYLNGCSYIAGHYLPENETIGYKLSKLYNVPYFCKANNGNSLRGIITTTISHLLDLDDNKNTLVLIGITWPDRDGFSFFDYHINFSPGDYSNQSGKTWNAKISKERRINNINNINDNSTEFSKKYNENYLYEYDVLFKSFANYKANLIKYDNKYEKNTFRDTLINLTLLESFFKLNNINYYFINYSGFDSWYEETPIKYKLDKDRIISLLNLRKEIMDPANSHPSNKGTDIIVKEITKKINNV